MEEIILEPPVYFANDQIFDIAFHPKYDIIAASIINGSVEM